MKNIEEFNSEWEVFIEKCKVIKWMKDNKIINSIEEFIEEMIDKENDK